MFDYWIKKNMTNRQGFKEYDMWPVKYLEPILLNNLNYLRDLQFVIYIIKFIVYDV